MLFISFIVLMLINTTKVSAASLIWDGEGADNNFSTDANWSGDVAPVNGDDLEFPTSVSTDDRTLNNDIVGLSVAGIYFSGTYVDSVYFTLSGNDITVTGNIDSDDGFPEINVGMTLGANIVTTVDNLLNDDTKAINLSTYSLTLSTYASIVGDISGSGDLIVDDGAGLFGDMTGFTGNLTINNFDVNLTSNCETLNNAQGITINNDGSIVFYCPAGASSIDVPVTLNGDGEDPVVENDANGETTYYTPAITINDDSSGEAQTDITISSIILGANSTYGSNLSADSTVNITTLTKNGFNLTRVPGSSGKLVIAGSEIPATYNKNIDKSSTTSTYTTNVTDKTETIVTGNQPNVTYVVLKGGVLGGTGTVGPIQVQAGGKLAPGQSPGCLSSGNLSLAEGGTFEAELGGATVCTEYDQQRVSGTVSLGSSTLSALLYGSFIPASGNTFTIIDNDGSDAVTGTFKDLPQDATFTVGGVVFKITYNGGDGNDVVLTVQSVPTTPSTGIQTLISNPVITLSATLLSTTTLVGLVKIRSKFLV